MMITGMKMTTNNYTGRHQDPANTTQSSGMRVTSGGRSGISALQNSRSGYKINGARIASNERKSSIGGDVTVTDGHSPYPMKQN